MRASVIVPVKNGAATLPACLQAIREQQGIIFGTDFELIVVDDGSTDATAEVACRAGARVISQPNAGPAAARNTGVRHACGEIVVFTDADCVPAPDWLVEILAPFQNEQVMGVKGVYRTHERALIPRFVQLEYESKYERMRHQERIDFIDTYSAAYRREVFLANDGFDEIFRKPSVEDQEFSFRLAGKGYLLVFQPTAAVYHRHDLTLREYFERKFGIGYWKAIMLNWLPEKTFNDSHTLPSQRWQIALLGLMLASLLAALIWPFFGWAALACLALFVLSTGSSLAFIAKRDPALLPIAVPMIFVRAFAQAVGLVVGMLHTPRSIRRSRKGLNMAERALKRLIDVVGAVVGLVVSAPVLLVAAIAIKLDSPGPVVFTQVRAGENGKPFRIYKLRTMVNGAEHKLGEVLKDNPLKGPVYKIPNDARVTRVGKILRRWSMDEIPQFWNILRGEMSLVGPRPEEVWVVNCYNDAQRQRLLVKPGLTGPMQVAGRGLLDMDERVKLEMDYVENYSLWKDILILLRSVRAVVKGDGAF